MTDRAEAAHVVYERGEGVVKRLRLCLGLHRKRLVPSTPIACSLFRRDITDEQTECATGL